MKNSKIHLVGTVETPFVYSHTTKKEKFYQIYVSVERLSGTKDILGVLVSDLIISPKEDLSGKKISVDGEIRTTNMFSEKEKKTKLILNVFCEEIQILENDVQDKNEYEANGYIVKNPIYRITGLKREISDFLVAVNRKYRKSDYIPCICWGRNAKFAPTIEVGKHISIKGRLQSRYYYKKNEKGYYERRTAYEVSVSELEVIENED